MFCGRDREAPAPGAQTQKPDAAGINAAPADLDAAIAQAQAARKAGDLLVSTRILSQLVLFAPDDPRVLGEYGKALAAQGRSDDALAFLERAIQLQPGDWSLYSAQGVAFDQKGAYPSAQASYDRALALKPGDPTVLNNAALSHMQTGDLDRAEQLLDQASPQSAEYPRIAQNRTLVQNLKAARPAAAPTSAPVAAADATPVAPVAPAAAPAIVNAPVDAAPLAQTATEAPTKAPVVSSESPTPDSPKTSPQLAKLQGDPTVLVAALPKDEPPPAPAKAVAAPRKAQAAVAKPNPPPPAPKQVASVQVPSSANTVYYVQAGSYTSKDRAGEMAASLDSFGARVSSGTVEGHAVYRVRIGPFRDVRQANAAISQAQSTGQADLKIVAEE